MLMVSHEKELLEQLRIKDRYKEIKARIVIGNDSKERYLLFTQALQIKLVGRGQRCKALKVKLFKSCRKSDLNRLESFRRTRSVRLVILQGDMRRVICFKHCEQIIKCAARRFIFLVDVTRAQKLHYHREVLLLGRCFISQIEDKCKQEH